MKPATISPRENVVHLRFPKEAVPEKIAYTCATMTKHVLHSLVAESQALTQRVAEATAEPPDRSVPAIFPLPRRLVSILEMAAAGKDCGDTLESWASELERSLEKWHGYPLHQAETLCLDQSAQRLAELRSHFRAGDLGSATESAFRLFRALGQFHKLQESHRQSRIESVNDLAIRGLSMLEDGSHNPDALTPARLQAVAEFEQLVALFGTLEAELPPEVRQAFLHGIDQFTEGLKTLESSHDQSELRAALMAVCQGAELLFAMTEWQMISQAQQSGPVPIVGSFLRNVVRSGELSPDAAARWKTELYPSLTEHWAQARGNLLVKGPARQELRAGIDSELESLKELSQLPVDRIAEHLQRIESDFASLEEKRLSLFLLNTQEKRWKADLLMAVLASGVPNFVFESYLKELVEHDETLLAEALRTYLESRDSEPLLCALETLLRTGGASTR